MNLELDVNEINFVLQTLGNLPSSSGVWPLIVKIKEQAETQLPKEAPTEWVMEDQVTHKQIYDRLIEVETKVDSIDKNTKGLVEAFDALQGAFKVLGWIASAAKPILWVAGLIMAAGAVWQTWIKKWWIG